MRTRATLILAAALALVGSLALQYNVGGGAMEPVEVEVKLAPLAAGSTAGVNATNATVTVAPTLTTSTTHVLELNNLNGTGVYYARLALRESTGTANLVTLTIGIDNGTKVPQVTASLGSLTQLTGTSVQLAPGSTNTIYITQAVVLLTGTSVVGLDVIVSDTPAENAFTKSRARVTID